MSEDKKTIWRVPIWIKDSGQTYRENEWVKAKNSKEAKTAIKAKTVIWGADDPIRIYDTGIPEKKEEVIEKIERKTDPQDIEEIIEEIHRLNKKRQEYRDELIEIPDDVKEYAEDENILEKKEV